MMSVLQEMDMVGIMKTTQGATVMPISDFVSVVADATENIHHLYRAALFLQNHIVAQVPGFPAEIVQEARLKEGPESDTEINGYVPPFVCKEKT